MASLTLFEGIMQVLAFPFKEKDGFKKIAIGSLLVLGNFIIPILPTLVVTGYCAQIMKRIQREEGEAYLPEWEDWGKLLIDGLKLWGVGMIYSLPIVLLVLAGMAGMMVPAFIPLLSTANHGYVSSNTVNIIFLPILIGTGLFCLAIPLGMIISFLEAPALGHMVEKDSFGAAFRIKEWWPVLKAGIGTYLLVIVFLMAITGIGAMIIQLLNATIILCFLYPFTLSIFSFLTSLYAYTLYALAYREGKKKLTAQG